VISRQRLQKFNLCMEAGTRVVRYCFAVALTSALLAVFAAKRASAHKPVTSKYDYKKDIFPLLREHCGRCHVDGGPAPMSLMTYKDAMPWAESIRDELTSGRMPPWPVDPTSPGIRGGHSIQSRDLDRIIVWASGGTPEGDPAAELPAVSLSRVWSLGPPDLQLSMPSPHSVPAGAMEDTVDFSLPLNFAEPKWIRAADLMPGTVSIVRDALIQIENGPVLAVWEPGADPIPAPTATAFLVSPGSEIHLRIHYKKHFDQEQESLSDKSTVGLYFTQPTFSGRSIESASIAPAESKNDPAGAINFSGVLPKTAQIVALRPLLDRAYAHLDVDAVAPSGQKTSLLCLLGPRPQWPRRYWLEKPVELPGGSRIEVFATPLADYSEEPKVSRAVPLELGIDYITQ